MRKLTAVLIQLLVLSCGLAAASSTLPAVEPPQSELGKWWKNSEIVKRLQLSEAQVGRIEQSFLNHRQELAALNDELNRLESQLTALMQADPVDESKVRAQTELVAASRASLERANASLMIAIRKDLTKEQWARLEEIRELRKALVPVVPPMFSVATPPNTPGTVTGLTPSGDKIYVSGGPVKPPMALSMPMPSYTQEARDARIEGIVLLQAIVRKDGTVDSFKVLRGLGYGLDESAIDTVAKRWRFQPGTLNGQPVNVQANIEISFRLY
jgi:TonB family protein